MTDEPTTALIPTTSRLVDFYGDLLAVGQVDEELYVALRAITDYLGLNWSGQRQRVMRDEVLARRARTVMMRAADGKQYAMLCLPLDLLPGWLFGITASRVRPELSEKLTRYREECFRVLSRAFMAEAQSRQPAGTSNQLAQVRDLALAIAQLAEQQMALDTRVAAAHSKVDQLGERMDRAAVVVGELQRRLGEVERRTHPATLVTEEQAAEVAGRVRALAELLTAQGGGKNQYQSIYTELYRRFGVSGYKSLQQDQYEVVLDFLDTWRQAALKGVSADQLPPA